jgi:uncharacterized protein
MTLGVSLVVVCAVGQTVACKAEKRSSGCERCPDAPSGHVDDDAGLLSAEVEGQLAQELANFERETGARIVLHIAPELPEGETLEEHTLACANCWSAGQPEGERVVIFLFQRQRRVRIEVSRRLEKKLTNQYCQRVIDEDMVPHFRTGDFAKGLTSAVVALMRAIRE